ncbi:hypothetical protein ACFYUL_17800 [Streptomyces sp. NPDC004311]|uniref:hypothetical protein n=1 Tax=Streptomyces sp. NPDC004311 TaxID=3364698 RepID=UPI0036848BC0
MDDRLHVIRFAPFSLDPTEEYDDTNDEKTAYATYGLAVYGANCMEAALVNAFAMSKVISARDEGRVLMTDPWAKGFKEAVKNLIPKVCHKAGADQRIVDDLLKAVDRRNFLIHRFWYERITEMFNDNRRRRLIIELQHDHRLFKTMDDRLNSEVLTPLRDTLGFGQDLIDAQMEIMRQGAQRDA